MIEEIRQFIKEHEQEMLALLERIVLINSYTANKPGVDAVGAVLEEVMTEAGFAVRRDKQSIAGDNLIAENALRASGGGVLLCGHMDTVFPPEDGFNCFRHEGETVIGPGVVDMKGGLVVGIYALKALDAVGLLDDMPVAFVFNSDEEIGSPDSQALIIEEAQKSDLAFVFECAGLDGEIVTARKGKMSFNLKIKGQAGHAGNLQGQKPSAILELAHQTIGLEALNDAEAGISVNAGVVNGGTGPNTVAPSAEAMIECRYKKEADGQRLRDQALKLAASPSVVGTTCHLEVIPGRPTMEKNSGIAKLYDTVARVGAELNIPVHEEARGGVSDANFIAKAGTPVLDGMGPSGARDHSHDEYMLTASLAQRTILAAVAIRRAFEALSKED